MKRSNHPPAVSSRYATFARITKIITITTITAWISLIVADSMVSQPLFGCGEEYGVLRDAWNLGAPLLIFAMTLLTLTFGLWRSGWKRSIQRPHSWLATPVGRFVYLAFGTLAGSMVTAVMFFIFALSSIGNCAG